MNKFNTLWCLLIFILACSGSALGQQASDTSMASNKVMMVLDGSNSMWGQIKGVAKISIAKEVMVDLISDWDGNVELGLMVYGHRRKNDCSDIEVVAMPGTVDRPALISKVQSISPRGKTPLTDSLVLAATSVGAYSGESSVIMVTDGLETCEADPCAKARTLELINPGFSVHVIGFDVTAKEFESLKCMAEETGGKFFRANNANELKEALRQTVSAVPQQTPTTPEPATPVASPEVSFFLYAKLCKTCDRLPPLDVNWDVRNQDAAFYNGLGVVYPSDPVFKAGAYSVTARYLSSVLVREAEVVVGEDGQQVGEVNLNGGGVELYAYASDDETLAADSVFYEFYPIIDGVTASNHLDIAIKGLGVTWLPAGPYKVVATHQSITEIAEITIVAGEVIEHKFDLRFGYLQPKAVLSPDGPNAPDMTYRIYASQEAADAEGDGMAFGLGGAKFALKAGDYVVLAVTGFPTHAERTFPVTVRANETVLPTFDMNAGYVDFQVSSASGISYFFVTFLAVTDTNPEGTKAGISTQSAMNTILPIGRYKLDIRNNSEQYFSDEFEIFAGQTTPLQVDIP